jgi:putative transposase
MKNYQIAAGRAGTTGRTTPKKAKSDSQRSALTAAVLAVFDHPVIARCQLHKIRNVKGYLPDTVARVVERRMRAAYANSDPLAGQGDLEALAKELERQHPGAAGSLREGLAETFTVA